MCSQRPNSSQNLDIIFLYVHKLSLKFISYHAEEKVSSHIQIQMYCSYAHSSRYLPRNTHTNSPPVLRQMGSSFIFCKCLVNHENHFIIPSVTSTVYPKHSPGLATYRGGVRPNDETPNPGKYCPSITYKTLKH